MFNDDASRNRAELEPIDDLTRSTTPRAGLVAIALGVLGIAVATWLSVGSIDHSLWLTGRLLDAWEPGARANDTPKIVTRLETEVRLSDAQHLTLGRTVFVFRNATSGASLSGNTLSGNIRAVQFVEPSPERPTATVQLDIEHDPSPALPALDPGEGYRLRVPVGAQRPIEMLVGFANPSRIRGP